MNFINTLAAGHPGMKTRVITTAPAPGIRHYASPSPAITLTRRGSAHGNSINRYLAYLRFNIGALLILLFHRPDSVFYYESISAFPAILYKKFIRPGAKLFIHYHEYVSPQEYANGMVLVKRFHQWERGIYPTADWISHTNKDRLSLFQKDNGLVPDQKHRIMPNYPPASWHPKTIAIADGGPVRLVYVGALGWKTTYAKEVFDWVSSQEGRYTLDLFSNNIEGEVKDYLQALGCQWIQLKDRVDYYDLPGILHQYQVGLILYKGHIPNYVYNAPNKLFEYHTCGLHVLYPEHMIGCQPFEKTDSNPQVRGVDFSRLAELVIPSLFSQGNKTIHYWDYSCETVYSNILGKL
ncbi:hypothetical protein KJS94_16565 [Flavihumibacter rivuli]|uniref:hypothetical protein n=1 Tax=Flavihumibacter rivuli TaxID=2838156 RepID=UPI001BDF3651|nr:hypothetical protein [Flavihumibacter rivuli]ULQ56264.1 hypothetical protein KJS94_16565 [Flavihumibacter rivuli]